MDFRRFYEQWATWIWICTGLVALVIGIQVYRYSRNLDAMAAQLELDTGPQASLIYDRDGRQVFSLHEEERTDRKLRDLSPSIVPAVLAAEDQHFRSHIGIDFRRIAAAAWSDVKSLRIKQGASTITQQLVRSQALGRERTWSRKSREILLALRIERRFTKDQILETYLNRIYLGDGYFGVEAAARGYFNKDASALDDSEAALLAGIIRCPTACSPRTRPDRARQRRDVVLRTLLNRGQLPPARFASATAEAPHIDEKHEDAMFPPHQDRDDATGLYFIDAVRRQLMARFGEGAVLRGGLRVYTTMDVRLERAGEEAIAKRLTELNAQDRSANRSSSDNLIEGSLVAIDPRSGDVLALVGGRDFHESPFNRAIQAQRQPGSAFKPILFAAALEQGYAPSTMLDNLDTTMDVDGWLPAGEHEALAYTMRQALIVSSNRAAARLIQLVGIPAAQYYARQLGITAQLPSVPSLALGTAEVSLIDLTSAYGVFANNGMLVPHTLITRVEDASGDVLWQPSRTATRAVQPDTAFLMSTMLADVLNRGTGSGVREQGFKLPAGGKTGTTDDYSDAWFVGYTPSLVAGVWVGRDRPDQIMHRGFAGTVAVPAWAAFMKQATAGAKAEWFPVPSDLESATVCQTSGMRATPECRLAGTAVDDYFVPGHAPAEPCSFHIGQLIGTEMLARPVAGMPSPDPAALPPGPVPPEHPLSEPLDGAVVKPKMLPATPP